MTLPSVFIPHGAGPCFFMRGHPGFPDIWDNLEQFLRTLASTLEERPRAILVVSAHWQAECLRVTSSASPALLYDYYGFPAHTYHLQYPVAGAPWLAEQVCALLQAAGFEAEPERQRGLDHGAFIPFKLIYPQADIAIVQLSLRHDLDPGFHLAVGRCLAPLREQGVLIVGSGMSFHNMQPVGPQIAERAQAFDQWLNAALMAEPATRAALLTAWPKAPHARFAHPREEHLLPLMVACGAALEQPAKRIYHESLAGLVAVSAFRFG
ncbi:DODA-type extradiol aromatic ring-opening family dioxygenase [Pseudomonas sp. 5P_3.1_Bac2]|uniref:DODA-type extradiol aromatic ring-opening family dioxygenase n=1 Tax=Pseudomonas sp. 5P_3.1_Bac2 TaxID=2971617 RepID=UPI0021CA0AE7|nr:class III extradiol ring-cleavage dioxygenase [Pseudomonas sp. 5P_3.1_Bac2]MCU1717679.1 dioxygenase [Pseudomonas sp. 5P_3.1_Bac2]